LANKILSLSLIPSNGVSRLHIQTNGQTDHPREIHCNSWRRRCFWWYCL